MKVLQIAALGVGAGVVILVVLSALTGVDVAQVQQIGWPAFLTAVGFVLVRLLLQGLSFYVVAMGMGAAVPLRGSLLVRAASEFVALSTPTYAGGEVVRIVWLGRRGVEPARALWIGFVDLFLDIMVSLPALLGAGILAALAGAPGVATVITLVVLPVTALYLGIFVISIKGRAKVPSVAERLMRPFLGPGRAAERIAGWERALLAYGEVARQPFGRDWRRTLPPALALSVGLVLSAGGALWAVFTAAGAPIDFLSASLVAEGAYAFGAVTPGGTGLTETGAYLFASQVYGVRTWAPVIVWRIAAYLVPLGVTGLLLLHTLHTQLRGTERLEWGELEKPLPTPSSG